MNFLKKGLCKTQVVLMTQQMDTPENNFPIDKGIPPKKDRVSKNFSQNCRFLCYTRKLHSLCKEIPLQSMLRGVKSSLITTNLLCHLGDLRLAQHFSTHFFLGVCDKETWNTRLTAETSKFDRIFCN